MLLSEIIQVKPLPFKWQTPHIASFKTGDDLYYVRLTPLPKHELSGVDVTFGVQKYNDLDTSLTNKGHPRQIMATVVAAVLSKMDEISNKFDYILLIPKSDAAMQKRRKFYINIIAEVADEIEKYGFKYPYNFRTNLSEIILLSKIELSPEQLSSLQHLAVKAES